MTTTGPTTAREVRLVARPQGEPAPAAEAFVGLLRGADTGEMVVRLDAARAA